MVSVAYWHPAIDASYRNGTAAPANHPAIESYFASVLPAGHPNVTAMILNPSAHPLPSWHPVIDRWVGNKSLTTTPYRVTVPYWHPSVDLMYRNGTAAPAFHPLVHSYLAGGCWRGRLLRLLTVCVCAQT